MVIRILADDLEHRPEVAERLESLLRLTVA
jgi:hypothetical protein